jgi:hypothetical protein
MPQALDTQHITSLLNEEEGRLAPEPVWTNVEKKKFLAPTVI